ncbi:MAG: 37S ribosomal Rsm22 [Lasallia pustulata]|uniref:37S ribosomal Rsm22 n=1 Tax=Lasallia pustulata TaxID=136370 RepID=A0A5M8PHE5_9LECA|nr:MAG: 37S ribosomal Rsm22 [Lasallia pustulata]
MIRARPVQAVCTACRIQLLDLFTFGFCKPLKPLTPRFRAGLLSVSQQRVQPRNVATRMYSTSTSEAQEAPIPGLTAEAEAVARRARETFGETLPDGLLTPEELKLYGRMYGPPIRATQPEDMDLLQEVEKDEAELEDEVSGNTLLRENEDGDLEKVEYQLENTDGTQSESKAQMMLHQDVEAATKDRRRKSRLDGFQGDETDRDQDASEFSAELEMNGDYDGVKDVENLDNEYERSGPMRTHPLTLAGRFDTSPSTLQLPPGTFTKPITGILADSPNKHLTDVALRTFGGPGLPNSTATPASKSHLQQKPIGLEASQSKMTDMQANTYLAAIMPGAYAAVMSVLVEVRKRLGTGWLSELLVKEDGPRILDAGAGGAGVLAWREVLQAEWESMHPEGVDKPAPFGRATVITGSSQLRHRASRLLQNTTFLPRLPDYVSARDLPYQKDDSVTPRKQYDIIVAPHTLWPLKEDYMRKTQVQNFWSLLNPNGGVLVIIEKGVPRGFELVAAARDLLLRKRIASPGSISYENVLQSMPDDQIIMKEEGMIIAPCTNHGKCPLYLRPGRATGRKDLCHFSQRYIRPPFLQRIIGAKERNHEDIRFSYIAVQRGRDKRQTENIVQGEAAADAAFAGYGGDEIVKTDHTGDAAQSLRPEAQQVNMLSLPRSVLPPLKRRGHIILDLCTPAGKIERWTIPKSFGKQAYRDARKSQWGDLWALGAKIRVLSNVRTGTVKGENLPKGKSVFEVDVGDGVDEGIRQVSGHAPRDGKRTKKGRKEYKGRKLMEDDF